MTLNCLIVMEMRNGYGSQQMHSDFKLERKGCLSMDELKNKLVNLADEAHQINGLASVIIDAILYSPNKATSYDPAFVVLLNLLNEHKNNLETLLKEHAA